VENSPRASVVSFLLLFVPPFLWSTNFLLGKALVGQVPPWTLSTGRFIVAALLLIPVLSCRREWIPVVRQSFGAVILMSLCGIFAFNALLYTGLQTTTTINAILVNSTTPVTTALVARWLIAEKLGGKGILGIVLSFLGVLWIVGQGSIATFAALRWNPGDLLVFVATLLWGVYSVTAKRMMHQLSPLLLTAMTTSIGVLFLIPVSLWELSVNPVPVLRADLLLVFLYLGLFPSVIALLLWNRSVLIYGPSRASLVYNTMPLYGVVLSVLYLGETLKLYQLIGGSVILAGVVIGTRGR
jgi:drug/metabolite transporter (DMT)-like permease